MSELLVPITPRQRVTIIAMLLGLGNEQNRQQTVPKAKGVVELGRRWRLRKALGLAEPIRLIESRKALDGDWFMTASPTLFELSAENEEVLRGFIEAVEIATESDAAQVYELMEAISAAKAPGYVAPNLPRYDEKTPEPWTLPDTKDGPVVVIDEAAGIIIITGDRGGVARVSTEHVGKLYDALGIRRKDG